MGSPDFINRTAAGFLAVTFAVLSVSTLVGVVWILSGFWRYLPPEMRAGSVVTATWKLAVINLLFSMPVWFLAFNRLIVRPLRALVQRTRISSVAVSSTSRDLAAAAEQVKGLTMDIATSMQQISHGAELQAIKIQETSEGVKEITKAIQNIAPKALAAANISEEAVRLAKSGEEATVEAIAKIAHVQEVTTRSADAVRLLETRSGEIGRIVDMITTIADQTNLLSLNAAIEAARAGESGRGFAVVADEVRKLAEGSARAAEKIAKLITEVQAETKAAVEAMEEGAQEVSAGAQVVQEAGDALKSILRAANETARTSEEIAGNLITQAESADIVDRAVTEIAAVVEENAAGAEETAAATEEQSTSMQEISGLARELADMAGGLEKSVSVFQGR